MAKKKSSKKGRPREEGITAITINGYKSISKEQRLEIRPLTILAGANSSGKSSAMQPLLLIKQTLEASYDPGPLLLNGPNVRFTSAEQLLSKTLKTNEFSVGIELSGGLKLELTFEKESGKGVDVVESKYNIEGNVLPLHKNMTHDEIMKCLPKELSDFDDVVSESEKTEWVVTRERCFLSLGLKIVDAQRNGLMSGLYYPTHLVVSHLQDIIHLPGLRGNPERTYPTTGIGSTFPGLFQNYVASIISHWESTRNPRLQKLGQALEKLGLTWKVKARQVDDTRVELKVGRLPRSKRGGARDLVSIADVGFGVSQTLPVVVALLVAKPGQMVYLEQPEIHLHPRAQFALAELLMEAAKTGVKVVVETHSSILLLGIQALVAEKKLSPELVKLHWFTRTEDGSTEVSSTDLDENGAFGDWPVDFGSVELGAQSRYLDASLK